MVYIHIIYIYRREANSGVYSGVYTYNIYI